MPATEPRTTPRRTHGTPLMTRRGRVVVLASACLVSATLALVQFQPAATEHSPAPDNQPQLAAAPHRVVTPAVAKSSAVRPATKKLAMTASHRPAAASAPAVAPPKSEVATVVSAPAARDSQDAVAPSIVTISGCLEQDDETFRLKDTAGLDAPQGRNWRSAFLLRNASTIDVIDQADRHHLPTYVGQRVSVTGTLVDREMLVRSVAIVAESCQERTA